MLYIILITSINNEVIAFSVMLLSLIIYWLLISRLNISSNIDFYFTILLSFLIAGAGLAYLGNKRKSLLWFVLQLSTFIIAWVLPVAIQINSKYLGLIIFTPFLIQLIETVVEYKSKHGDIELF